jgi:hypothetical protein
VPIADSPAIHRLNAGEIVREMKDRINERRVARGEAPLPNVG